MSHTRIVAGAIPVAFWKAAIIVLSPPVPVRTAVSEIEPELPPPEPVVGTLTVESVPPEAR